MSAAFQEESIVAAATQQTIKNDIPMREAGYYNSNSGLQFAAMLEALPLFEDESFAGRHGQVRLIEYGSAQGSNSIRPFQSLINLCSRNSSITAAELLFTDRPQNDFTTLSQTIAAAATTLQPQDPKHPLLYPAMIPRSFYEQIVPRTSIHAGFSFAALHHLEAVPAPTADQAQSPVADRASVFRDQARRDLLNFLKLRAEELMPTAPLVLSFVSTASSGEENYAGLVSAVRLALLDMVRGGIVSGEVAARFEVPTYNRTFEDVQGVLDEVMELWGLEMMFEKRIEHPASVMVRDMEGLAEEEAERNSRRYAAVVVDWFMAVVSGYFVKALRLVHGEDLGREERLVQDWANRTIVHFLGKGKCEPVACWFIYVKLRRV